MSQIYRICDFRSATRQNNSKGSKWPPYHKRTTCHIISFTFKACKCVCQQFCPPFEKNIIHTFIGFGYALCSYVMNIKCKQEMSKKRTLWNYGKAIWAKKKNPINKNTRCHKKDDTICCFSYKLCLHWYTRWYISEDATFMAFQNYLKC